MPKSTKIRHIVEVICLCIFLAASVAPSLKIAYVKEVIPTKQLQFISPIKDSVVTSNFGSRSNIDFSTDPPTLSFSSNESLHFGVDLVPKWHAYDAEDKDTNILAAEDGIVVVVFPVNKGQIQYGGCVMLRHIVGTFNGKKLYAYTFYGHMKKIYVKENDVLLKGETIGLMGSTGISTGPHLHFEILFDPMDFIDLPIEIKKLPVLKDILEPL